MIGRITENILTPQVKTIFCIYKQRNVRDLSDCNLPDFFSFRSDGQWDISSPNRIYYRVFYTQKISKLSLFHLAQYPVIGILTGGLHSLISLVHIVASIWDKVFNKSNNSIEHIKFGLSNFFIGLAEMIPIFGRIFALYNFNKKTDSAKNVPSHSYSLALIEGTQTDLILCVDTKKVARCSYYPIFKHNNFSELEKFILQNKTLG